MAGAEQFLYRGTTIGWPGRPSLSGIKTTPTSIDPLVATLFAIECSRHGPAVVYMAPIRQVAERIVSSNWFAELECEIGLAITPLEFANEFSGSRIQATRVREILRNMGVEVPEVISSRAMLDAELERRHRLTETQITALNAEMLR